MRIGRPHMRRTEQQVRNRKQGEHRATYFDIQQAVGRQKRDAIKENRFLQICHVLAVIRHLGLQLLH